VIKRVQRLKELEGIDFDDVAASGLTKKELLGLRREKDKLEKTLGGIRDMARTPQAVWIVDTKKEHLAVDEARKLRIPVIAILDTNCDPDEVDYAIPGNDDAIRSVSLLTRVLADAVADGLMARSGAGEAGAETPSTEPMPDWERELLAASQPTAEAPAADAAAADTPAADAPATDTLTADNLAADTPAPGTPAAEAEELTPEDEKPETAALNAEEAADKAADVERQQQHDQSAQN
jgi:small subunit ribosomal protein S2